MYFYYSLTALIIMSYCYKKYNKLLAFKKINKLFLRNEKL